MKPHKTKSFPFSALILLCRLFAAPSRHSLQAVSALDLIAAVRFPTTSENRKTKSFPFSAFCFQFFLLPLHDFREIAIKSNKKYIFYLKLNSNKNYGNKQS